MKIWTCLKLKQQYVLKREAETINGAIFYKKINFIYFDCIFLIEKSMFLYWWSIVFGSQVNLAHSIDLGWNLLKNNPKIFQK